MRSLRIVLAGAVLLLVTPLAAPGQEALEQLTRLLREDSRRLEGKEVYVERLEAMGVTFLDPGEWLDEGDDMTSCIGSCLVYKVEDVNSPDGTVVRKQRRLLSPMEVSVLAGTSPGSDMMEMYGAALMAFQLDFNEGLTGARDPTGNIDRVREYRFGDEDLDDAPLDPWMDPFALMYTGGAMVHDASQGVREAEESLANSATRAQAEADEEASALSQLEESGVEEVGGRSTIRYTAAALDMPVQEADGQQFEMNRASLWVDPEELVLVKHRFEGTATADGESREFFIEVVNSDFRNPPGCGEMYEPYRRVQRIGGILDDAQMAEMEEARRKLEEFDRQMAEMPAEQRQMAERMMGSQMDAVRSLADGGAIEHVQEIEEILCDPDLKALFGVSGMDDAMPDELLARIQQHLVTLGYEPGNTNGVLDPMTRSAISQFQTELELPVTGEPSAQLENVLAAEVENQGSD